MEDLAGLLLQPQGLDGRRELLGRDVAALIVVEDVEAFLEPDDIVDWQVLGRVDAWVEGGLFGERGHLV